MCEPMTIRATRSLSETRMISRAGSPTHTSVRTRILPANGFPARSSLRLEIAVTV